MSSDGTLVSSGHSGLTSTRARVEVVKVPTGDGCRSRTEVTLPLGPGNLDSYSSPLTGENRVGSSPTLHPTLRWSKETLRHIRGTESGVGGGRDVSTPCPRPGTRVSRQDHEDPEPKELSDFPVPPPGKHRPRLWPGPPKTPESRRVGRLPFEV